MEEPTKKKYHAPDGTLYDSQEDNYNDPLLDSDIIQCALWRGKRTPQNDYERDLLKAIEEAKRKGEFWEIYPE